MTNFSDMLSKAKAMQEKMKEAQDQIKNKPQNNDTSKNFENRIQISSFQDLIELANKEKEVELKYDLERNVKLVSFNKGKIDISFNEKLNQNFIKNLTEKLLKWTGERWIISLSKNNDAKSLYEQTLEKKSTVLQNFQKTELANMMKEEFPDAELIDVQEVEKND